MAKFLQTILDAREPLFSTSIRQLERMTGRQGIDVRYIADISERAHAVMRRLGLDVRDTTAVELYAALNANAEKREIFRRTDDVALIVKGEVISFNQDDVLSNTKRSFSKRTAKHVRCQIQYGLTARYAAQQTLDEQLVDSIMSQAGVKMCDLGDYHEQKLAPKKESKQAPYMLCIGDIFTDAFIQLDEKSSKVITESDGKKWLAVPYGQKPPYSHVDIVRSVGPSPNAAVSGARLGMRTGLMAWVGGDDVGKEAISYLVSQDVDTSAMVIERDKETSYWYVLRYKSDRTMLVKSEKYAYKWTAPKTKPDWIYLSYIGEKSWQLHVDLLEYLEKNPDIKLVFQPGTFHFEWGAKKLKKIYERSHIVVMNREEAVEVTGASYDSLHDLAQALHDLGPEIAVITDGPNGSYASYGGALYNIPNYPDPAPPVDRTGAGDAFASTFVSAIAMGESLDAALTWAPINSMNVVQHVGAQIGLLKNNELKKYLKNAPEWYKTKEMK